MKAILANKLLIAVIASLVIISICAGVYFGVINKNDSTTNLDTKGSTTTDQLTTNSDFQRTGQNSFGLAVCDEMTKEEVTTAIGKPILKTQDYSNSGSTGCEYFVSETGFVIIDVGYGDMANQKIGLLNLDRIIKTESRIKLENMMVYSDKGLVDVYMNIAPSQKYVRVGRSSTSAVDEETLTKLAIATELKIRSYK